MDTIALLVVAVSTAVGLDANGFVAALSLSRALTDFIWFVIVLRLLQFDPRETVRLAVRAVGLAVVWSAAQEFVRLAFPTRLGPFLGALVLALALAPLARKWVVYSKI